MATAKGLGGGFPVGACLTTEAVGSAMTAGSHGSTFGGNPLAMAVGNAVLDVVLEDGFLDHVAKMGLRLKQRLAALKDEHGEIIEEVRGQGLMLGLKCKVPNQKLLEALRAEKMLTVQAGDNVVRLLPPLIVGEAEIELACSQARCRLRRAEERRARPRLDRPRRAQCHVAASISSISTHWTARRCAPSSTWRAAMKRKGRVPKSLSSSPAPVLAMIFEKPSTRTRVSFEVAMHQLGGSSVVLDPQDMQLGRGETLADTARVLSRYVDAIMLRTGPQETLTELAAHASVPVINGLTCRSHPCQVMADVMTFEELKGPIKGRTIAWIGDANNVATSWVHAAARFGLQAQDRLRRKRSRRRPRCSIGQEREGADDRGGRGSACRRRAAPIAS